MKRIIDLSLYLQQFIKIVNRKTTKSELATMLHTSVTCLSTKLILIENNHKNCLLNKIIHTEYHCFYLFNILHIWYAYILINSTNLQKKKEVSSSVCVSQIVTSEVEGLIDPSYEDIVRLFDNTSTCRSSDNYDENSVSKLYTKISFRFPKDGVFWFKISWSVQQFLIYDQKCVYGITSTVKVSEM